MMDDDGVAISSMAHPTKRNPFPSWWARFRFWSGLNKHTMKSAEIEIKEPVRKLTIPPIKSKDA